MSQGRTQGSLTSVPQTQTFFPTVLIHGEQKKPNPLRLFLYNLKRKKIQLCCYIQHKVLIQEPTFCPCRTLPDWTWTRADILCLCPICLRNVDFYFIPKSCIEGKQRLVCKTTQWVYIPQYLQSHTVLQYTADTAVNDLKTPGWTNQLYINNSQCCVGSTSCPCVVHGIQLNCVCGGMLQLESEGCDRQKQSPSEIIVLQQYYTQTIVYCDSGRSQTFFFPK